MNRIWGRRGRPQQHDTLLQHLQLPVRLERGQQLVIVTEDGTRHRIIPVGTGDIAVLAMTGPVAADPPPTRRGWPAAGDPVLDEQL